MAVITSLLAVALAVPAGVTWTSANSVSAGDQDHPAMAANRNGDVAVVWEDDQDTSNPGDNTHSEIFLRRFHNGTPVYETTVAGPGASGVPWKYISPDVGLDDKGNAVVVWADDADGNGTFNVYYRVVSPTGGTLGSGRANALAAGQQTAPKVAVDPDGTPGNPAAVAFTIVWVDQQGTNPTTVKAAGYTNVTTKAYEVTASQTTGTHGQPDVAASASGDALIVWDEDSDGNGFYNVGLVRLARASGAVNLSRRTANAIGDGQQQHATIAADFTGDFAISWESDQTGTNGVWTRSFLANGTPRHSEVETSSGAGAADPSIGIDDQANVVVGWNVAGANPDVWARGLNPDGTDAGRLAATVFSTISEGRQEDVAVTSSPWGEISVCYTDDHDGNSYDQIYLGLGASNSNW